MNREEYDALHETYIKEMNELREKFKKESQTFFQTGSKALFESFPELESFGWQQFTPYFNDGDPCYFRVRAYPESVIVNGEGAEDYVSELKKNGKDKDEAWKLPEAISNFVNSLDTDMLQEIFGDHVRVTLRRGSDEAEVADYSYHD